MAKIQYERDQQGVHFADGRTHFMVLTEGAVEMVWGPLIGHTALSVYHVIAAYCARRDNFHSLGIRKLAKLYKMSPNTWLKRPLGSLKNAAASPSIRLTESDVKRGVATTYVLLDCPNAISEELIFKLTDGHPEDYECGAPWWMDNSKYLIRRPKDDPPPKMGTTMGGVTQE